jgi:hypothetical protein
MQVYVGMTQALSWGIGDTNNVTIQDWNDASSQLATVSGFYGTTHLTCSFTDVVTPVR